MSSKKNILVFVGLLLIAGSLKAETPAEKLTSINPHIQWIFMQNQNLPDRLNDFLSRLPSDLNQNQILRKAADLVLKYGHMKDKELLFDRLEKEVVLHKSRFARRAKSGALEKYSPPFPESKEFSVVLEDFQVNENVGSCNQTSPAIASASDGSYVITWVDERNTNTDIYAQRFNSSCVSQGPSFRVNNDQTNSEQINPDIAVDVNGNFIIVWQDYRDGNADIYAQRYDVSGNLQGDNFKINDNGGNLDQKEPAVDIDENSNFVIVWQDKRNDDGDVYARRYNNEGSALGASFMVNSDAIDGRQGSPDIGLDSNGNFTICWSSDYNSGGIYA